MGTVVHIGRPSSGSTATCGNSMRHERGQVKPLFPRLRSSLGQIKCCDKINNSQSESVYERLCFAKKYMDSEEKKRNVNLEF